MASLTRWTPAFPAHLRMRPVSRGNSRRATASIESVMPSSNLILCRPLLLLPPIPPSIRVFSNESTLHMRWPKYWSFSFSIIPSKEHSGLISFRMDWLDLLAVQGTLIYRVTGHLSSCVRVARGSASWLSSHGRGLGVVELISSIHAEQSPKLCSFSSLLRRF